MKFDIIKENKGKWIVLYREEEHSFDTSNSDFSNTDVLINDINLGINEDTMQIWGFSPKTRWETMDCPLPPYFNRRVVISDFSGSLIPQRLNGKKIWKEYYNPVSKWMCIDSDEFRFSKEKCVMFIDNAVALITDGNLLALWIKA